MKEQAEALKAAQQALAALKEEIARLKSGGSGDKTARTPCFRQSAGETRPTETAQETSAALYASSPAAPAEVVPACQTCPDCHGPLRGGWERSRRQGIDLPPLGPRRTDHVTLSRPCGRGGKTVTPRPDLSQEATGQQTFGHGGVSLRAYLKTAGRVPIAGICRLLSAWMGRSVSAGQVTERLPTVARQGKET